MKLAVSPLIVLYDACVLYPAALRDLLIRLAVAGLCQARWSDEILDEAFDNLKRARPDLDPAKLDRTRRRMRLWNLASGACERAFESHDGGVHAVESIADGRALSGGDDGKVRLWNLASGVCEHVFEGHNSVLAVAAVDGGRALSSGIDGKLLLWNLASGACKRIFKGDWVFAVVAGGGGRALSGGADDTVRVWDLTSGACEHVLAGHDGAVLAVAAVDGRRVLSGGVDGTVRVWDLASGACFATVTFDAEVWALAVQGTTIVVGDSAGGVHGLDLIP